MFNYTLVNQPKFEFKEDVLKNIFKKVEKFVKKPQSGNINIVFLNNEEIRDLNKKYRWIDKSTDVLSFHYYQNFQNFEKYDTVWEVILSEQKILSQSEEYGITIEKEFSDSFCTSYSWFRSWNRRRLQRNVCFGMSSLGRYF